MHQIKNANSSFAIIQSKHVSIVIFVRKNILYKVGSIKNNKTSVAWKEANPNSPRARGVLFVLKGPYDTRVPPIVKFSQESESARLTKIILSKSTVKTL